MRKFLKNCRIIDHGNNTKLVNITIEDGNIKSIEEKIPDKVDEVIDIEGNLVTPGLVDIHVHLREPGYEYKETIRTGTLAAAHGGYTTVCAMPNINPVPDSADHLMFEKKLLEREAVVKVLPYATITKNRTSEIPIQANELADAFAFSNDGSGVQTAGAMYQMMKAAVALDKAIVAHAEDISLMAGGMLRAGNKATSLGVPAWSPLVESTQIARDLLLAKETGVHYHVCHVSTKESVHMIREAKSQGVCVTAEVCPHHLILTDEDIPENNAMYKMNPPLPSREDQVVLIEGLLDGTIDCIATDHAPHSTEEKEVIFEKGAFGIVGSETAFSLMFTEFVKKGIFTLEQLIEWMSLAPARIFGIDNGGLKVGDAADLAIFDIEHTYRIDASDFESKGTNTPFLNWEVKGKTLLTLVDGSIAWKNDSFI